MRWLWPCLGLSTADASRLLCAILAADLPGFRTYLPSVGKPSGMVPSAYLSDELPAVRDYLAGRADGVHLLERLDAEGFCDTRKIRNQTGWQPIDVE